MGTIGAYGGAGGKAGRDLGAGADEWIDSVSGDSPPGDSPDSDPVVELPHRLVAGALSQLRPRSGGSGGDGGGPGGAGGARRSSDSQGGGQSGGLRRSTGRTAGRAGRAGAAAYAFATGDRAALAALGLDYDALRALRDPIEVTRQIVGAACGELASGTLEDHEERYVAASVAEWVLEQAENGATPTPEEIVRHSIATVVAEVLATEISSALIERPDEVAAVAEDELFAAAEVLADKVELSVTGATDAELSKAIEDGIETMKRIYGVSDA